MKYILLTILPFVYDLFSKEIAAGKGLVCARNYGISFGLLQGHVGIVALFNIIISALLIFLIIKEKEEKPVFSCGLSLLLGGTLANLAERLYRGYVTDWIYCPFSGLVFGNGLYFNLADVFIGIGVLFILAQFFLIKGKLPRNISFIL